MQVKAIFLIAAISCISFTVSHAQTSKTKTNTSAAPQPVKKVKYLYQTNAGFTVYFDNGTYARKAGEYTDAELKGGFKNLKAQGKWKENKKGIVEDGGEQVDFKDEDGGLNYQWGVYNYKAVNN